MYFFFITPCLAHLLFTPLMKDRFPNLLLWRWLNTWHTTLERWERQKFISNVYSQSRGGEHHRVNRVCGGKLSKYQESEVTLGSHRRTWSACSTNSSGGQGTEAHYSRDKQELCLVPMSRRVFWLGKLYPGEQSWEENLWLDYLRLFWFYQLSMQHLVLILGLISHLTPGISYQFQSCCDWDF